MDTPEDLLTSLINATGLKQNLKRGSRLCLLRAPPRKLIACFVVVVD